MHDPRPLDRSRCTRRAVCLAAVLAAAVMCAVPAASLWLSPEPDWMVEGTMTGDRLGFAVSTAGDVDGDTYADVIVGAPFQNSAAGNGAGVAYVFYGAPGGLSTPADWSASGSEGGMRFGYAVAAAGDVNGDTYADIVVGTAPDNKEGYAAVFLGSGGGLNASACFTATIGQPGAHFGAAVAAAGDVNGDTYADVVVGAPLYANGQTSEGAMALFYGADPFGSGTVVSLTFESDHSQALFGAAVGTAGDVDRDGYADVVVGAPGYAGTGAIFIFYGASSGLILTPTIIVGGQAGADFGAAAGTAGDVNADGYADVIVGAPQYDAGDGAAFIFLGTAGGLAATPAWIAAPGFPGAQFGAAVGTAGDVNADGYADVVVGAPVYDNDQNEEGAAFVFQGSANGPGTDPIWHAEGNKHETLFGAAVGTAGDVNDDGCADVIVGAAWYFLQTDPKGAAFAYLGSGDAPHTVYLPIVLLRW
ncbi:MAG: FG-GAP repeat protein [Anaerolineae bacterium]|nr:FG-GAP repeat protein [Anaerolineae bacterium]